MKKTVSCDIYMLQPIVVGCQKINTKLRDKVLSNMYVIQSFNEQTTLFVMNYVPILWLPSMSTIYSMTSICSSTRIYLYRETNQN